MMHIDELKTVRKKLGIQMVEGQLFEIVKALEKPLNYLVFGLGNDSIFWHETNKGGRTVFIEDNQGWYQKIKGKYPFIEAYRVEYGTKRSEWEALLNCPEKLHLALPDEILNTKWDVVLVDGPPSYLNSLPGRMKSIYMASILVKEGGHVFVHDCQREIECLFCDKYLGKKELLEEVKGVWTFGHTILRHYS